VLFRSTFTRDTGHKHPGLDAAIHNYRGLLVDLGDSHERAIEKIRAIAAQYGVDLEALR